MKINEKYHYTECGLDNIYITGLQFQDDIKSDNIMVPAIERLHKLIAEILIHKPEALNGKELFFLRYEANVKRQDIAELLNINVAVIADIENNNKLIPLEQNSVIIKLFSEKLNISSKINAGSIWSQELLIKKEKNASYSLVAA